MNIPNKITIARIILVPLMMIVPYIASCIGLKGSFEGISYENIIVLVIFLIASLTDYLDGHLARKNNMVTNFGKFLDPIADKLLVFAAFIMLVEKEVIPGWIVTITAAREFMVAAIRMLAAKEEGTVIAASMLGKIKTVTQMVAISLALMDSNPMMKFVEGTLTGFPFVLNALMSLAMILAVIATIWSGTDYFIKSKDVVLKSK